MSSQQNSKSKSINNLLHRLSAQLHQNSRTQQLHEVTKIKQERRMHHSFSLHESKRSQLQNRPLFNNKTKEGNLLQSDVKLIPYTFIPKYKNDTFIMPDRIFQKGSRAKRFYVKMKDTSIYSFSQPETNNQKHVLKRQDKDKTILSRQIQEYDRIVDVDDGRKRSKYTRWNLKNSKRFIPTSNHSKLLSQCQPMIGPKDSQTSISHKIGLTKTFDNGKKWINNSRYPLDLSSAFNRSKFSHNHHASSVL